MELADDGDLAKKIEMAKKSGDFVEEGQIW